jgi:hypothetical protein
MEQIYILLFIVILFILLNKKEEKMCDCQRVKLDYYGHRKCMDWNETRKRRFK